MVAVHLATSDIGLEEGEYWKKLSLYYSVVYCYNGAQTYEQFLQVGWVYRALILLLCIRSSWCYIYILKIFAYILLFTFGELSLVGVALDPVD